MRADVGGAANDASSSTIALAYIVVAEAGVAVVGEAISFSRKARRVLRQDLVFSAAYKVLALGLAAFGTVSPLAAAGAMAASSQMVIVKAGRLRAGAAKNRQDLMFPIRRKGEALPHAHTGFTKLRR